MAADGTDTHAGTDDWYGSITISNVELYCDSTSCWLPPRTSRIATSRRRSSAWAATLAIGVYGAPDLALDFVGAIENCGR